MGWPEDGVNAPAEARVVRLSPPAERQDWLPRRSLHRCIRSRATSYSCIDTGGAGAEGAAAGWVGTTRDL